jgi:hypothetical protein
MLLLLRTSPPFLTLFVPAVVVHADWREFVRSANDCAVVRYMAHVFSTIKTSNLGLHGNFEPFLASSVASLDEL